MFPPRKSVFCAFLFCAGWLALASGAVQGPAQGGVSGGITVDVVDVGFHLARSPFNSAESWFEIDVTVEVKADAGLAEKVANRVKCALSFATDTHLAAGNRRSWHQCEAEVVALFPGRHHLRFYLPPEIAKRDSLRGPPRDWLVEFSVAGRKLAVGDKNVSKGLRDKKALNDYRNKLSSESPQNEGVLQPQCLTPFENAYSNDTPTYIRRS